MANPILPSASSIVDYLDTKGQDSSFSARKSLYNTMGFNKMMGEFVGSASQNLNLLKKLQNQDTPQSPAISASAPVNTLTQTSTPAVAAVAPPVSPTPTPSAASVVGSAMPNNNPFNVTNMPTLSSGAVPQSAYQTSTPATTILNQAGFGERPKITRPKNYLTPAPTAPTTTTAQTGTPEQKSQAVDTSTAQATGGISASSIYPDIFTEKTGGEADVVNTWLNSAEGQAFISRQKLSSMSDEAKAEATKKELETKYAADKATLENALAANGLAFSGIRGTKVKALADSLAASELGIDRELAFKLLESNADLRDAIVKGVADLAKDAADGRKEAIQQLNAIGYAVVGDKLVPTLAARSAERADINLELSERRLQLAEESAARAEERFNQLYGTGKSEGFNYVRSLMDLNPNATRAELKAAALENANLTAGEIDAVLDTIALTPTQAAETAKALVAQSFDKQFFATREGGEVDDAREAAKNIIRLSGGLIKVGGRTITLNQDQIAELEGYIDTVTAEEALDTKKLLEK